VYNYIEVKDFFISLGTKCDIKKYSSFSKTYCTSSYFRKFNSLGQTKFSFEGD